MNRPVVVLDDPPMPTPGPLERLAPPGFEWAPRSAKLRCTACGARGHPRGPWMAPHAVHPYACRCGRRFASLSGLRAHEKPRRCTHHHEEVPR